MLIPQGYKQTEFGIIPNDWDVTTIGKACYINPNNGEIPNKFLYIDLESVNRGILEKKKYINKKEAPSRAQRLVKKKDVLFQLVRPYQQNNYFNTKYTVAVASTGYAVLREHLINIDLIYQIIHTKNFTKQVLDKCTGTSYPAITSSNFENVKFCYPKNYLEQKCIATVLNDTDKLINNLNKLIKKKIAIKQGVMQELLTGKRRLPGFNGKWVKKRLGDIVEINKGSTLTSSEYVYGNIPVMAGGKDYAGMHNTFNRPEMTITISASGANAGFIKIHSKKIFATDCSTIVPNKDYNIYYMYYNLLINQNVIYNLQTGGAQPHVHPKDLYSLYIEYSTDLKEQQAIANVLTDMDDEIKKLEIKLQKYKNIKQGMMQELLTGRIRLLD